MYPTFLTLDSFITSTSSSCLPGQPAYPISFSCVRNYRFRTIVLYSHPTSSFLCVPGPSYLCSKLSFPRHRILCSVSPNNPSNPTHITSHHARTQTLNNIPNTPSPSYSSTSFSSSFPFVSIHVIHCHDFTTFMTFYDTTTPRWHTLAMSPQPSSSSLTD